MSTPLQLTVNEARVVASLVEKAIATPAYYPMTVNGLMAACNQKTSRSPVLQLTEGEVGNALLTLEDKSLVSRDDLSSRATKWRHKFQHQLLLKKETLAVLVTLILRGPQTPSELRANASGIGGPDQSEAVLAALQDLADRAHPLVCQLARAPGQSAARWAHLLSGTPAAPIADPDGEPMVVSSRAPGGALEARVAALEAQVATLTARLAALEAQLGVSNSEPDTPTQFA